MKLERLSNYYTHAVSMLNLAKGRHEPNYLKVTYCPVSSLITKMITSLKIELASLLAQILKCS